MIGVLIFISLLCLVALYFIYRGILAASLFKYDETNPYRRHCTKCGAHQTMYSSNIEGNNNWWWEECYPLGNNDKCKCHSFTEYHP